MHAYGLMLRIKGNMQVYVCVIVIMHTQCDVSRSSDINRGFPVNFTGQLVII